MTSRFSLDPSEGHNDDSWVELFAGDHQFLSNFWVAPFEFDGETWPSAEHAFQAAKTSSPDQCQWIRDASSPIEARRR